MENIILIETSTALCSTALAEDGTITSYRESSAPKAHASLTAVFVQEMLSERGLTLPDCDAVCVSMGPGSYTGLRVGVSTAKGLCFGAGKPLLAVGTLDTLVAQASSSAEAEANVEPRSGLYPSGDFLPDRQAAEVSQRVSMLAECRAEVLEVLKRTVRPEFLNRIDEVIMFEPLSQSDIRDILRMQMRDLQDKLSENGVTISFTQEFEDYMSTKGYEPAYGARPIKRLMQKELINLLAKSILDGHVRRDSVILVDVHDGQIVVSDK